MANRVVVQRGRRRNTAWDDQSPTLAAVTANGSALLVIQTPGAVPITVVRIRGSIMVVGDTSTVGQGESTAWALGIGVVPEATASAGVGSLPTPITDANWDGWMYHRYGFLIAEHLLGTGEVAGELFERVEIDCKAMRKLSTDQVLVTVFETLSLTTGFTVDVMHAFRLLTKLG